MHALDRKTSFIVFSLLGLLVLLFAILWTRKKQTPYSIQPIPTPINPAPTPINPYPTPINPTPTPVNPTPTPIQPPYITPLTPITPIPGPSPITPIPKPSPINPIPGPSPITPIPAPSPITPIPGPSPITPIPAPSPVKPKFDINLVPLQDSSCTHSDPSNPQKCFSNCAPSAKEETSGGCASGKGVVGSLPVGSAINFPKSFYDRVSDGTAKKPNDVMNQPSNPCKNDPTCKNGLQSGCCNDNVSVAPGSGNLSAANIQTVCSNPDTYCLPCAEHFNAVPMGPITLNGIIGTIYTCTQDAEHHPITLLNNMPLGQDVSCNSEKNPMTLAQLWYTYDATGHHALNPGESVVIYLLPTQSLYTWINTHCNCCDGCCDPQRTFPQKDEQDYTWLNYTHILYTQVPLQGMVVTAAGRNTCDGLCHQGSISITQSVID